MKDMSDHTHANGTLRDVYPEVTIAVPTYNRSELLKITLKSILEQDYPNIKVLVLDNASPDTTDEVVKSFADKRITYVCNEINIGMFRNWNRAIELNSSPYLCIFSDDDVMLQDFIKMSVKALDNNPLVGFSFSMADGIDINGATAPLPGDIPDAGIIHGLDYLHNIVSGKSWVIWPSTVMMRSSALSSVGPFDIPHSRHTGDLNLYLRMAAHFDIMFIPKLLCKVRMHADQEFQIHHSHPGGTGQLATMAERTDAVAYLLQSSRAKDGTYRQWLADRLLHISMNRSELSQFLILGLNLTWTERIEIVRQEISSLIPTGYSFILVDEDKWGTGIIDGRHIIPFLERDGRYWGAPPDDTTAILEFKRLWKSGAHFIVFGWPAFWWLDYYSGLRDYLGSKFHCIVKNSRLIVFDLCREL